MTTWLFDPTDDDSPAAEVLDITMRFEGGVTLCVLDGPLCAYTAPTLDDWLGRLQENDRTQVIVDASHLTSMSSDGVDVLLDHAARCRRAGGRLQVRSPSSVARRVLRLCGAQQLLESSDT